MVPRRRPIDWAALHQALNGRCFICEMLAGTADFRHEVVYQDAAVIAFLNKYPSVLGHVLVAPKDHREAVTGDFDQQGYLIIQAVVYLVAEAVRVEVPTERIYIYSLGSQEGNRHVHWHIAPLPQGVAFNEQQFRALDRTDVFDMTSDEMSSLAGRLRSRLMPATG